MSLDKPTLTSWARRAWANISTRISAIKKGYHEGLSPNPTPKMTHDQMIADLDARVRKLELMAPKVDPGLIPSGLQADRDREPLK